MLLKKYPLLVCFLFCSTSYLSAQTDVSSLWLENLEELSADLDEQDWEEELEELSHRIQEPLNLNTVTRQELEQFPFLTPLQMENIQAYLYIHGQMQTIYELQLVEEMDRRTIDLLLPFVCVKPLKEEGKKFPKWKNILKYGKHEVTTRLDIPFYTREGYKKNFLGTKEYHSLRYRFHYGDYLQVGVTGEKDAGEPFFALHDSKGYDFYSYYLQIRNLGRLENLVLGNYRLSFGQGLVLGNGFHLGKSYSLATSDYRATGIRKYASTDEFNFFRGVAATVRLFPSLDVSAFYSYRTMDGTIKEGEITSIYKTGLHRTEKEAEKLNTFAMQMAGGHITFDTNRLKLGATGIWYCFDRPYEPSLQKYAKYNLHGNHFYNVSLDYLLRLGRLRLTGEAAKGKEGYAVLNQLSYSFSPDFRVLILHRYYAHDFWAFYARSFGEGTTPQNENGWYVAAEAAPFARWRFFVSADMFSFPWWKYRISKPSQGVDIMAQAAFNPRQHLSMFLNYRYKWKERDVTGTSGAVIRPIGHHRLRYRLTFSPANWLFRTTLDYNRFLQQEAVPREGYQVVQSCAYTFPGFPCSLSLQGSYFHTDDYDTRVYAYEKGLLNTFYTPSFYGRGFRYSAHVRLDFGEHFMLVAKLGQTIYQNRETISSGNDLINGNKKTDLQIQARVKF